MPLNASKELKQLKYSDLYPGADGVFFALAFALSNRALAQGSFYKTGLTVTCTAL